MKLCFNYESPGISTSPRGLMARIRVYCQTVMASVWFWCHLFPVYSPGCRRFYQAIITLFSTCILFQLYILWAIVHWFHALEVVKFIQLYWLHTFYLCQVSMVIITPSKCNSKLPLLYMFYLHLVTRAPDIHSHATSIWRKWFSLQVSFDEKSFF